jgi:hypothetical protein
MPRIHIEDLPRDENLTEEQAKGVSGGASDYVYRESTYQPTALTYDSFVANTANSPAESTAISTGGRLTNSFSLF